MKRFNYSKRCAVCGEMFQSLRSDAVTCSPACRAKKSRGVRSGQGRGWYAVSPSCREMADAIKGRVSKKTFSYLEKVLSDHGAIAAEWAIAAIWNAMQDYKYGQVQE